MGILTMYHAIHAFGLTELLKSGIVTDVDDEHFWNLIDNTYIDDVSLARKHITAGHLSFPGKRSNDSRTQLSI